LWRRPWKYGAHNGNEPGDTNNGLAIRDLTKRRPFRFMNRDREHTAHYKNGKREWYNGSIVAFQAIDPGSTPGSRTDFDHYYSSN
jgi:hypothetical protein